MNVDFGHDLGKKGTLSLSQSLRGVCRSRACLVRGSAVAGGIILVCEEKISIPQFLLWLVSLHLRDSTYSPIQTGGCSGNVESGHCEKCIGQAANFKLE